MKAWSRAASVFAALLFSAVFTCEEARGAEESAGLLLRQCGVLERYGQFAKLCAVAERLCVRAPRRPEAWRFRARALEELGRDAGARAAWNRVLELDPRNVEALCAMATMDAMRGALDEARRALERVGVARRGSSAGRLAEAVLLHRGGAVSAAHRMLAQAMATASGSSLPWLIRADLLVEEGRVDEACRTLSSLLGHRPDHPLVLTLRGMLRLREGDHSGAVDDLEAALRKDPADKRLNLLLIRAYEGMGRLSDALAVARSAAARVPDDVHLHRLGLILDERLRLSSAGREERRGALRLRWGSVSEERRSWVRKVLDLLVERARAPFRTAAAPAPQELRISFLERSPRGMPAHYDYEADELFVDGALFGGESLADRRRAVAILLHELSHVNAYHASGRRAFARRALWLVEGLAELQARGAVTDGDGNPIRRDAVQAEKILDGLSRSLAISSAADDTLRRKAYRSAHMLVSRLVRRLGSLERVLSSWAEAMERYGRGQRHDEILRACWRVGASELLGSPSVRTE